LAEESEPAFVVSALEPLDKQPAKESGKDPEGKEESRFAGNPAREVLKPVRSEAVRGQFAALLSETESVVARSVPVQLEMEKAFPQLS
jgi:hypothetical protein